MSVSTRILPTSDRPPREALTFGLILLLLADLVLVAFLRHAPALLALTAAILAGAAFAGKIPWAVALLGVGVPVLDPINVVLNGEEAVFYAVRIVLITAILVVFLARSERPLGLAGRLVSEPIALWAVGLGAVVWLGSAWTPSPYYAHQKVVSYLITNLLLLVGGYLVAARHDPEDRRADARFDAFLIAVIVFALLIALAGFINLKIHYYRFATRLNTLGINAIWIARTMGLGLFALLAFRSMGRVRTRTVLLAAAPLIAVTILAGSRGPTLGIVFVLVLWVVFFKRSPQSRRVLWIGGIGVASLLFLLLMPEVLRDRFIQPVTREASGLQRLGLVKLAFEALGHVFGPGIGTGGFSQLMRFGDMRAYPHNIVAEVGIENGLLGLAALGGFCATTLARGVRGRADPRMLAALIGFVFAFWNAQFSGDLMANEWIWLYAGLIAGRTRG
jgi:O-antigen ligase